MEERPETPKPNKQTLFKMGGVALSAPEQKLIEPGEHLVTTIRRHPIGLFAIYGEMGISIIAVAAIVGLAIFSFLKESSTSTKGAIGAGFILMVGFLVALFLISAYIYRTCRLIVTDKSVVLILQRTLFNKKISRLSMSNVEDVNLEQNGILPTMFNYGTLIIQTAGEVDNFVFPFCPKPDEYANRILEARQQYVRAYGRD